jgi:hypothetical protein
MRVAVVVLGIAMLAGPATGQPAARRIERPAFPFSVIPSVGLGFGDGRASFFDPEECPSPASCYQYGTGSGWQAGVDLQVPLGRALGFEVGGQVGRPSLQQCLRGLCTTVGRTWVARGTGTLVWRFKPRAPVYFGLGGALAYFKRGPVFVFQDEFAVTEVGATAVVGVDFAIDRRLGGRVFWRSYLMVPSSKGIPDTYGLPSVAWDNAVSFAVRVPLGT